MVPNTLFYWNDAADEAAQQQQHSSMIDFAHVFDDDDYKEFLSSSETANAIFETPPPAPLAPPQPFVNVVMIIDPTTQQVLCPKQVLEFESNGRMEKTVFGPIVLDQFNRASLEDFTRQFGAATGGQAAPQVTTLPSTNLALPSNIQASHSLGFKPITPMPVSGKVSPSDSSTSLKNNTATESLPPLRALSAYNFFFRDERDRILHEGPVDYSEAKQVQLLSDHWNRDRTKKRRHRKTHGKIDFTTLSKLISSRWKALEEDAKEFYRTVAAKDWDRYQKELAAHKKQTALGVVHQAVVG